MTISQKDFILVISKTNGRCFYCNRPAEQIDHFVSKFMWKEWNLDEPLGSADQLQNLFPACRLCNVRKSNKCPEDFMVGVDAWDRYTRANFRVGLSDTRDYNQIK